MAERGTRTRLRFGGITAEVSLYSTSGKPKGAAHETKRVLVEGIAQTRDRLRAAAEASGSDGALQTADGDVLVDVKTAADRPADPLGEDATIAGDGALARAARSSRDRAGIASPAGLGEPAEPGLQRAALAGGYPIDPDEPLADDPRALDTLGDGPEVDPAARRSFERMDAAAAPDPVNLAESTTDARRAEVMAEPREYVPPATTVQQGVHTAEGAWIDLTARLAEVDERTKLDGLEVIATIDSTAIPRERVRDAKYVGGAEADTFKVLALLHHGLRARRRAAVVRYTAKTAQKLGIIVARGSREEGGRIGPHLVLLELEWAENMREASRRVTGPIGAEYAPHEAEAAVDLVDAFASGPSVVDDLRDERLAKRAELLALAREGKLDTYTAPPEPMGDADAPDLATALAMSADVIRAR